MTYPANIPQEHITTFCITCNACVEIIDESETCPNCLLREWIGSDNSYAELEEEN